MKYNGFESPIDWSQYLIQKADKHEYEPSEPGKRVEALLEKLYLPQNSYSYAKFPQSNQTKSKWSRADLLNDGTSATCKVSAELDPGHWTGTATFSCEKTYK